MEEKILEANKWATEVWTKAVSNWKERSQDHNYRDILARPGIYSALLNLPRVSNGKFLDIGCGEGAETLYIRDSLSKLGWSGQMFGYDPQNHFIQLAKQINQMNSLIPINFGSSSINDFLEEKNLSKKIDLLTSIFVLQDLPNIEEYLENTNYALDDKTGTALFLLVHPNFGEAMKNKGAIKLETSLNSSSQWQWAGEYPIVEEKNQTFFVPYFHRTVEEYKNYFKKYFSKIELISLKPSSQDLKKSERELKSPFYKHPGNVYYPEIAEMESSLIIIAKR